MAFCNNRFTVEFTFPEFLRFKLYQKRQKLSANFTLLLNNKIRNLGVACWLVNR